MQQAENPPHTALFFSERDGRNYQNTYWKIEHYEDNGKINFLKNVIFLYHILSDSFPLSNILYITILIRISTISDMDSPEPA